LPWKPKTLFKVWPGAGNCQLCWFVNWNVVPGVLAAGVRVTFHWPTGVMVSGKFSVNVQLDSAVVPALATLTSTWKKLPPVLDGVAVQVTAPPPEVELLEDEELELLFEEELEELDELLLELEELEELEDALLDELLLELDELVVPLLEEELELLELEELLDDDELEEPPLELPPIEPAEAVRVTRSSRAPSSRRLMRSVCVPAARLLNAGRVSVPKPVFVVLFCAIQAPPSIL
jgi:hypothetical protein